MDEKEREIADLKARLAALESASKPSAAPAATKPPQPSQGAQWGCAAIILVFGFFALAMCNMGGDSSSTTATSTPDTYTAPTWTPPEGYVRYPTAGGGNIGVKWSRARGSECTGYDVTCFAMDVVTEKGCPRSLYAAVKILSKSGDNIGWTNDTAQGVDAGERVRLVFHTYERGAATAQIAEINCY